MKTQPFQAIIFDFDGVILDSEPLHFEACCQILQNIGVSLTYDEYSEKYLGLSDKELFPKLLNQKIPGYKFSVDQINSMIQNKIEKYIHIIKSHENLPFSPALDQFIHLARQAEKKIAICSGATKPEIVAVLSRMNQKKSETKFDTIVTVEDVVSGKPSPEGYLLTSSYLGIPSDQCLVIEDSPYGIEAAKKAGMFVIALLTTHDKHELKYADMVVSDFKELKDLDIMKQVRTY